MSDWSSDLNSALADGNPVVMKAMLARVPVEILQRAVPYLQAMAENSVREGKLDETLTFYTQLIEVEKENVEWLARRADVHFKLDQLPEAMEDANRIIDLQPQAALGYRLKAQAHDESRERPQAIAAYRQVLRLEPGDATSKQRLEFLEGEVQKEVLLRRAINPAATNGSLQIELPQPPPVEFDPALLENPAVDESFEQLMVDGLRQLLRRYSAHQSPKNVLARLEDSAWISAWDTALGATRDSTVLFHGSELGVLALRARHHGAKRVIAAESSPLVERLVGGVVQKNLLIEWRKLHGSAIQSWPEDERRKSFEAFARGIDIVPADINELKDAQCDYLVFPDIDHSLLGTGIVKAIRRFRSLLPSERARILPARARLFAMPVEWTYASSPFQIESMNEFRWSFYPQALEPADDHWMALAAPTPIGTIDFENFVTRRSEFQFPISKEGRVDAVIYWFQLDLGTARVTNAHGGSLRCIRPAIQYCDPIRVAPGQRLPVHTTISETRLHIEAQPAARKIRLRQLPSWYVPMLLDRRRNEAFRETIRRALVNQPATTVLDIGAGCGLLSMMAAEAGATHTFGCEVSAPIAETAKDIVRLGGFDGNVTILSKDCRKISVPDDMPVRADLALFELFDCSLIGEGVLHFLSHARQHLLREGARYLPCRARIRAAVIEYRLDQILGVDVNLLNPYRFSPTFINVDACALNHRVLTEPFDVFHFDFATATQAADEKELSMAAIGDGTAGAVLFWFDLQLDEATWLSNAPGASDRLHWKQGLQFLPEARISSGTTLPILAKHNGSSLNFQWKQDGLPKDMFSALPRFDPRWWQQSQELEQQTQGLLQHCMHNPEEYGRVAELAKRIAIDPTSHDVDPAIAQRFARIFFGT